MNFELEVPDLILYLKGVFIISWGQNEEMCAGKGTWVHPSTDHMSIGSGPSSHLSAAIYNNI